MMEEDVREFGMEKEFVDSDEEEEYDEKKHAQLLDAIASLGGQHKPRLSQRTIPGSEVSEFGFGTSEDAGKVSLTDLVKSLKNTNKHGQLKKQLQSVKNKKKIVSAPLSKPETERLQRSIAYECTKADVSKWAPVIEENRKATQITFPLNQVNLKIMTTDQVVKQLQPCTPLEVEVAALLKGSKNIQTHKRELTLAEEKALKAMSLEEARERRAELQKFRALMSYKEVKAKRQKRIKSKRYHRILKKERQKQEKKALEIMKQKDPEAYLEKLQEADRSRIQERMSLKHRGGSKFARRQMMFGKFDQTKKQAVHDMVQKNRELTKKIDLDMDSDEAVGSDSGDEGNTVESEASLIKGHNPWMSSRPKITKPATNETTNNDEENDNEKSDFESESDKNNHEAEIELTVDHLTGDDSVEMHDSNNKKLETNIEDVKSKKRKEKVSEKTSTERKRSLRVKKSSEKSPKTDSKSSKKQTKKLNKSEIENDLETDQIELIFEKLDTPKMSPLKDKKRLKSSLKRKKTEGKTKEKVEENSSDEDGLSESLTRKTTLEEMDSLAEEPAGKKKRKRKKRENTATDKQKVETPIPEDAFVDPNKLLTVEKTITDTVLPDLVNDDDDDELDSNEQQRQIIEQAFADDDVVDEFMKEKSAIVDRDKPKDIDLTLPGWGEWGGAGVQPSAKRQKRFLIKAPEAPPRRDNLLGNVIISEVKDKTIAKFQVSDLPFPCMSMKQFEQSIRTPIGKDWNPEMAFNKLVEPKVVTKLGMIISPIDKEETFKNEKNQQKNDARFKNTTFKSRKLK